MAMDRDKEDLQDWIEGDAIQKANAKAEERAIIIFNNRKFGKDKQYYMSLDSAKEFHFEEFQAIFNQVLQEVRNEEISNMEYRRTIETQRELDDLQEQERRVTDEAYYAHEKQVKIADERYNGNALRIGGITGKYMSGESDLIYKQSEMRDNLQRVFGEFDPNKIATYYREMARQFNIEDITVMKTIIEQAMQGNEFDITQFCELIGDSTKKEQLQQLSDSKDAKVTLQDILEFMQPIIENRSKQAEGFMQVAQTEIDVRNDGLHKKTVLASDISHKTDEMLTDFVEQSAKRDEIFLKSQGDKYEKETSRIAERTEHAERKSIKNLALRALKDGRKITTEDLSEIDRIEDFVTKSSDTKEKED